MVLKAQSVTACLSHPSTTLIALASVPLSRNHACLQAVLLSRSRWSGDDSVRVRSGWCGVRGREGAMGRGVVQAQTRLHCRSIQSPSYRNKHIAMLMDYLGFGQRLRQRICQQNYNIFRSSIQSQTHNTRFQHYTLYITGMHDITYHAFYTMYITVICNIYLTYKCHFVHTYVPLAAGCLLCVACFHHLKRVDLLQLTDILVLHLTAILLGGCGCEVRG